MAEVEVSDPAKTAEISQSPLSPSPASSENKDATAPAPFKPTLPFYLCFITLSVITLAVALDATSLSVALPVRLAHSGANRTRLTSILDHFSEVARISHRSFLVRNVILDRLDRPPA